MRSFTALVVLVSVVALSGCSGDTPTSLSSVGPTATPAAQASLAEGASESRPISGHCELTTLSTVPAPAPPVFRQTVEGTCQLSQLGRTTVHFIQIVNFGTSTQQSVELTYTAANGDVLRAASAGTSTPSAAGVSFSSTITFIGGTGRFANATGQAHAEGTADLAAGTSEYALDGRIAFDASATRAR
jgi:hypothetical protein